MEPATESEEVVILIIVLTMPTIMTAYGTTPRAWDIDRTITKDQSKSNSSHLYNLDKIITPSDTIKSQ